MRSDPESATPEPGFQLFETMRVTRDGHHVRHLDRHLARMAHSAALLAFRFDRARIDATLNEALVRSVDEPASSLRLVLAHDGDVVLHREELLPLPDGRVALLIEPRPITTPRPLARHKTTLRVVYDEGVRRARLHGAYDSLFFTADGRMVEGGRSNVFLLIDGCWWTPPLTDGALPGVMRALLLEDPVWRARERTLRLSDVQRARSMMVCNAVRGAVPGQLMVDP